MLQTHSEFCHDFLQHIKTTALLLDCCRSRGPVHPVHRRVWSGEDGEHEKGHSVPRLRSSFKTEKFSFATYGKSYFYIAFVRQS
jgi:hypothetical protein